MLKPLCSLVVASSVALALAASGLAAGAAGELGKTKVLKGQTAGVKLAVTPTAFKDNVSGYGVDGRYRVGCLTVKVKNLGTSRLDEIIESGSVLVVQGGGEASSFIATGGSCDTASILKLPPGKSKSITVPFRIRKEAKVLLAYELTTSSGFGETASWKLR